MRTLIGLFQDSKEARETISDLQELGARIEDISVVAPAETTQIGAGMRLSPVDVPGFGRLSACGPVSTYLTQSTAQSSADGIVSALIQMGITDAEARRYVDGVRQGYTLETIRIDDDKATQALEIMRQHIGSGTQTSGARQARGKSATGAAAGASAQERGADEVLPVIVEELEVGKREVRAGGVRATARMEEIPAEQEVTLREESVDVERRAVDRPVTAADDAFQDRDVEVIATSEEPIVTKRARVIEEVVIRKNVDNRTQTVSDTVRRTDVDVQPFDASAYKTHYDSEYGGSKESTEYDFTAHQPAYSLS